MPLKPVARQSVADAAFTQLFNELAVDGLAAGSELPPERVLTDQLSVNRQAVREALSRLAQLGLVEVRHGTPTRVRDFWASAGLDVLPLLVRDDGSLNADMVRSIFEMRSCVGPHIARLCAERAPDAIASRLADLVQEMGDPSEDPVAAFRLHDRFWTVLVEGSGNVAYRLAFNSLHKATRSMESPLARILAVEVGDLAAHRAIVEAIGARDSRRAERAARRLLDRGAAAIEQALEQLDRSGAKRR
jgi:DNA-binding FadR family transcriptional regulator